ncbi:MAG: FdhF/YdeP family oxidoreductase [Phycisphaeraceae bacterium]|nr:FdhF/YdeP family oxidoreductase [Phycisphaeraceae bacterium]
MRRPSAAGGWPAIWYTLRKSRQAGGILRTYRALRSRNACKTCALGMGGQRGGMVNEAGRFPEVCKKSVQAMAADMQGRVRPGFFDEFSFDSLGRFSSRDLESSGRLVEPLIARPGDRSYQPATWEEALNAAADGAISAGPDRSFFYFSGRSSNEAGFLLQLIARLFGTNNVNNCSYFCHQASGVGLSSVVGSGTATIALEDLDRCDLLFLIGGNPASNHPRFMRTLMDLRRRGGRIVVINPLRELGLVRFKVPSDVRSLLFGTPIATHYIQPHAGGDLALLAGLCKAVIDRGAHDAESLAAHTDGFEEFLGSLDALEWVSVERESGVRREQIDEITDLYAASKRTVFAWTMGITHHARGVENVRAIAALALLRGMVGSPGAGLLPLRGHSNVQGIGSVGATPALKQAVLSALESRFGVSLPTTPGLDTLACVQRAADAGIGFAFHLGGNLFGSCPDAGAAHRALSSIDTTVFLSTTLNTGHIQGRGRTSIILPVLARDEDPQSTTQESMFNFVRLSDGGAPRHDGPRPEVEVIADLAQRLLPGCPLDLESMRRHATIREAIGAIIPGYERIGEIDRTKEEFAVAGRVLHEPRFPTPTGRARLHPITLCPPATTDPRELRLMTLRSEGQFNTVVYEEHDLYRGQERRDVIMMHAADIERLGFRPDDRVTVRSGVGEMRGMLVRAIDIRAGNAAMYYPEANVLVPQAADPLSRTPAFKCVPIRVERELAVLGTGRA